MSTRNHETIYHSKWFLGNNHITIILVQLFWLVHYFFKKNKIPVLWSLAITSCFCFIWRRAVVLVVNRLDKMWFWAVILFLHFLHLNNNPKEQFLTTIFSNNLQQYSSTTILNELFFTIILLLHFLHLNKANFPPNISSVQWRHNKEIHQEVCDIF